MVSGLARRQTGMVLQARRYRGLASPPASLPDKSRYGNNGVFTDVTWVQGPDDIWVMSFNGASSLVTIGDIGLVQEQGTIEFWLYYAAYDANFRGVFTTNDNGGAGQNDAIRMEVRAAGAAPEALTMYDGTMLVQAFSAVPLRWQFMTVTWDGTNMQGYTNSTLDFDVARDATVTLNDLVLGRGFSAGRWHNGFMAPPKMYRWKKAIGQVRETVDAERRDFGV